MAKGGGSQLAQLKSALSQAGLSRKPPAGKKRKRSQSKEPDNEKRAQKLDAIQQKLNPFDVKTTKLKHDVGGRKVKGVSGKPQHSKQAGIEQRKKTLLKEYQMKDHAGGIVDRRIGENDPTMSVEERMLERFTKERQRSSKNAAFNLEQEDELTHYGQSLSQLDDFDNIGLGLPDEEDEDNGKLDRLTVRHTHFGGFEDDDEEDDDGDGDQPPRKRSKAEVMAEVVAKSKHYKMERQLERQNDDETRQQLDDELGDIRSLLFAAPKGNDVVKTVTKDEDRTYDVLVKELVTDRRAKPKDRTKTGEELAVEAKEALEKAERKRLKRMMGEEDSSSDEEGGGRKRARRGDGDDLEDDFQDDEYPAWDDLGEGLVDKQKHPDDGDDTIGGGDHDENGDDDEEGEGEEENDGDGDDGGVGREESNSEEIDNVHKPKSHKRSAQSSNGASSNAKGTELPFTFPSPKTHEEFLDIVKDVPHDQIPTVVQRIRTLYHPSLGVNNKSKMQALTGVLIEYILHISSPPDLELSLLVPLIPHIRSLSEIYPTIAAESFISKLKLMQKNLTRGLGEGSTSPSARTWPGPQELSFLWVISHVWPTSDMNHHVVSPARILMNSYLGLCRVRSLRDIGSGLFLSTLFLRYEERSKRFSPETYSFILTSILFICRSRFHSPEELPGCFSCPDLGTATQRSIQLSKQGMKAIEVHKPNLIAMLSSNELANDDQTKMNLLGVALDLLAKLAEMFKSLDGFIELIATALEVVKGLRLEGVSTTLKAKTSGVTDALTRMLKFAQQAREPLQLQQHKPIPIATYIPKFEATSSSYLRRNDPDHERAEASKLRYQYKQERKGAIRELRKDARFLSDVKHKEQQDKDDLYKSRMNKVYNKLEGERAEQKQIDKEKLKEKKRAGRR